MPFDPSSAKPLEFDPTTAKPAPAPTITGPQPSTLDRVVASPPVRLIHDFGGGMLRGAADLATMFGPLSAGKPAVDMVANAIETPYQAALARNRNTPGYAAARANADQRTSGGFMDQMTAPFNPAMAGIAGAPGGLDAMNANADAQAAAQENYSKNNPVKSFGAGMAGGLLMAPQLAKPPAAMATLRPMADEANKAGYVLAPRMISDKPGVVADTLAGWSGKVKTAQGASAKNQEVTNALAISDLGLPADTVLTDKVFESVRKEAGKAYAAIPKALPNVATDKQFLDEITTLGGANSAAASEFPDIMKNADIEKLVGGLANKQSFPTSAGVELVKKLRRDASNNFRNPDKAELAFAQRDAANALDNLIDRNLAASGDAGLVKKYREARQIIAKSHDLEDATNTATGNVSARRLAALANRGKPLSGGSKTIADVYNAFPKALQSESAFGEVEPLSVLDMGAAALSLGHGNPTLAGALLGKPIARKALLSKTMQDKIVGRASQPVPIQLPQSSPLQLGAPRSQIPFPPLMLANPQNQ